MPRKKSYLTATDCFCGAGGSSQGIKKAGVEVAMALNHWKLAIETHNTNFPDTRHDCTDVSACDPRRYPSTDLGIFSPECTTLSPAGGNNHKTLKKQMDMFDTGAIDPATERSRATMWDVVRFTEYHKYNCVIVENVVEAKTRWGLFDAWLSTMQALGYNYRIVFLNSMHAHPTPQSRDRMYVVFWKKGNKAPKLDYMPAAHCATCSRDVNGVQTWKNSRKNWGKYRTQYVYCCPACSTIVEPYYYAAFNIIDWSDTGMRIGDRTKPLVKNTLARIQYGLDKYGSKPLVITQKYASEGPAQSVRDMGDALRCQPAQAAHGLLTPFLIDDKQTTGISFRTRSATGVTPTMHTEPAVKLITPFLIDSAYGGTAKSLGNIKGTQTTQHTEGLVTTPMIVRNNNTATGKQSPGHCKAVGESIGAITADDNHALLTPPFIPIARGESKASHSFQAVGTQSQMINHGICTPPLITELQGTGKARLATRELNGVSAGGIHSGIVTTEAFNSFITYYYGSSQASGITDELKTVNCNDRAALISYQTPAIEDCNYRMLFPREIQRAMAFGDDYIVLGSSKDKVKQLGNAVTPPAMEWLVKQCVESLA